MDLQAYNVGIGDLKHNRCKTSLIMDLDEDRIVPYCPRCKKFLYDRKDIRLSNNPETHRNLISMILIMASVEFRVRRKRNEVSTH